MIMDLKLCIFIALTSCLLGRAEEARSHPGGLHLEPQIAMLCDPKEKFINKRIDETGKWVTDWEHKATCIEDKVDILEYCRKVSFSIALSYEVQRRTS
ncbi:unnamed protein product [Notodromas monacha]|uniref:E1 domain-containing protein n=1 Tax=Notodromas monacha TaxID=399045 RepID=A0A7R9BEL5_9CRUS|nr:unnamed protein product [Notodromas monacha]CAG0913232.1 unnamed protein product [Notodromas monacha]